MSIFRMVKRLSGRWPDSQGYCGVRDFDEPQVQNFDKIGTEFYLGARNHELDRAGSNFDDIFAVLGGARVKF